MKSKSNSNSKVPRRGRGRIPAPGATALWLFDFDNTLALLEPCVDWAASRRELEPVLRAAGVLEHLFEQHPRGNLLLYNALHRLFLSPRDADLNGRPTEHARPDPKRARALLRRASAIIEKYELAGVDRAEPLPGAFALVHALRVAGAALGIVTSNSSRTVTRWLKRNRLAAIVPTVVGRDSLLPLKPAADMLQAALKKCGVSAADAAYVGDSEGDLIAAREAGLQFFAIAPMLAARDRMVAAGAERIFASPAALAIYLNLAIARAATPPRSPRSAHDAHGGE
ncbi:MAG TPA: HAD-IA family hydrolase [Candidatus Binataceae bacterium]